MLTHGELVARQAIERLHQFRGLGDREVAGVSHPVELALQQRLPSRFREKGKRLCQHERERRGQQAVVHSGSRGRRVLLDAQHGPDASLRRSAVLDGLVTEEQPGSRQCFAERSGRQRHSLPLTIDQHAQELEDRGTPDGTRAVGSQDLRLIPRQRCLQCLGKLRACIQRVRKLDPRPALLSA